MVEDPIQKAVEAERARCVALLELYREDMKASGLDSLWCRIFNQITLGIEVDHIDFGTQFDEESSDID